jgi:MoaA/NifB/PqqE/SkfB family radical SAM enzyme
LPESAPERQRELSFHQIRRIADEARALGCRRWQISGGEPMLRPDFPEIFDYLTSRGSSYGLNTNGTLITPEIAHAMRRKGTKMVALYGADSEVYDHVTRHPGGFEKAMRGFDLLKQAGAAFIVQLIPMRDNWHQWDRMIALAEQLSPYWRMGAPWLFKSASGSAPRNCEIESQRLSAADAVSLDSLMGDRAVNEPDAESCQCNASTDDRLFAACVERSAFHIDAYGRMSFCCQIMDPALRFDLLRGSFAQAWDHFLPSLADRVRGGAEYREGCGACDLRADCRWCGAYARLETGRHAARVPYLCAMAEENRKFRMNWEIEHKRHYRIAGLTLSVESDLPITDATFNSKFECFRVPEPGDDVVRVRHHFGLPQIDLAGLGKPVYDRAPWTIYRKGANWIYLVASSEPTPYMVGVFNSAHTRGEIYSRDARRFEMGNLNALTMFTSDQVVLARVLAQREGFFLHSSGAVMEGRGLLFVGHSEAGKSTTAQLLDGHAGILCDDRNVVRRGPGGWWVHGSWSHGQFPVVSSASAPLCAIFFLRKSPENRLTALENRLEILDNILGCLIRPLATRDWWEQTLPMVESLARGVPCYLMEFDRSGAIVPEIQRLVRTL